MKKVLLIVLVVLIAAAAYFIVAKPRIEIHITEEQIQTRLEKQFPYERRHLLFFKTVFSEPRVRLEKGSGFIGVGCSISIFLTGVETLKSKVYAETDIHYDPKTGSVYLINLKLKKFELQGLPAETEKIIREIVGEALLEIFTIKPVYQLDKAGRTGRIAHAIFKDIKITDGMMALVFGL
ncbi:MAG: DUF1439 domain-containing protein [Candidatus Mycalebacterium zealandia]|nr:MAG: DUF1439 domain-containing protein [Candidatus Mycalebacterium zealandia]